MSSTDLSDVKRRAEEHDGPQTLQRALSGSQLAWVAIGIVIYLCYGLRRSAGVPQTQSLASKG